MATNTDTTTANTTATNAAAATNATTLTDASLGIQTVSLVQDTTATNAATPTTNLVTAALLPELVYAVNAAPTSLPNAVAGTIVTTTDTTTTPVNVVTDPVLATDLLTINAVTTTATDVATPVDLVDLSATINTVDPLLTTSNGAPLVVIDPVIQTLDGSTGATDVTIQDVILTSVDTTLIDPPIVLNDTTVITDIAIPVDTTLVDTPVVVNEITAVTNTSTSVDTTLVNTPVVINDTTVVDTPLVNTPVVNDTTVITDTSTPVEVPVNTVTTLPEDITQPAADPVLTPVITSITDSAAQAIVFGGSTQDTQPTLHGTSEPGTIVNVLDNGTIIGQATTGDDWQWSFTPQALTSGEVHTFSVDAARADGSGATVGAYQVVVGVGTDGLPLAAPVITDIVTLSNGTQTFLADGGQTDDLRPTLRGTSEPGTLVDVLDHGVKVGQAVANADWQWEFQPAQDLGGNTAHSFTVTASHADGSSLTPSVYASTITIGSVTVTDTTTTTDQSGDVPVIPLPEDTTATIVVDPIPAITDVTTPTDNTVTTGTDTVVVNTTTDTPTLPPLILDDSTTVTLDQLLNNAGLTTTTTTDTTQGTGTAVDTTNTATTTTTTDTTTVHTCPYAHATATHDFAY